MNWRQSPLLLGAWLASVIFLLAFVVVLIPSLKAAHQPNNVLVLAPEKIQQSFPEDFGRLNDLVPFTGETASAASESVVPEVEHDPEFRDESWIKAQPKDTYTIQVLAVQDEANIKRFLAARADRSLFDYFLQVQNGQVWYVLIYGRYPSLELARGTAVSTDFGSALRPYPKIFDAYQSAIVPVSVPETP